MLTSEEASVNSSSARSAADPNLLFLEPVERRGAFFGSNVGIDRTGLRPCPDERHLINR